jgi:hypothetical protein
VKRESAEGSAARRLLAKGPSTGRARGCWSFCGITLSRLRSPTGCGLFELRLVIASKPSPLVRVRRTHEK